MSKWLVLFVSLAACGDPSFPAPDAGITPPADRFPCARTVSPAQGRVGADVTLTGEFGDTPLTIQFSAGEGSETAATVRSWSPTQVVVAVPAISFGSWSIALPHGCQLSAPPRFEVLAPPRVYINNNANGPDGFNTITTMIYDPDTGALTPMGPPISTGIPASGRPGCSDSLEIVHGRRLYASGDTGVAVFGIDGVTGGLELTSQGSLFPPGLTGGAALRFSIGAYLWAATGAGIVAWRLDTDDHLVRPTVISAVPARTLQLFGDRPTQLYATRGDGTFDGWSVSYQADPAGFGIPIPVLAPLDGSPYGTSGAAVPDTGTQFVASRDPDDRLYVPTPAGLSLWAVDHGARSVIQRIDSPFALTPPSGTLGGPLLLGTARSRVLYMPAIGSGFIVGAALDATGAASAAAGSPWNFAPGVTNLSCMVAVDGATPGSVRLIASDAGNRRIAVFDLPAGGAMPVSVAGSPFSMTYTPSELASGIAVLGAP